MQSRAHLRVLGVPVRIEPFFVIVAFILAIRIEQFWLILAFALLVFVSILVHELGHAFVYRFLGQRSAVVLHGFGGFTVPTGGGRRVLSKGQSIAVSLAGIVAQLLVLYLPARYLLNSDWVTEPGGLRDQWAFFDADGNWNFNWYPVLYYTAFINLWWAVFNALPIRPLDGGHVAEELIGLDNARRLSIGAAVVGGLIGLRGGYLVIPILMGLFAFQNYRELKEGAMGSMFDVQAPEAPPGRGGGGSGGRRERKPPDSGRRGGRGRGRGRRRRSHLQSVPDMPDLSDVGSGGRDSDLEAAIWNELRDGDKQRAAAMLRQSGSGNLFLQASVALTQGHPSIAVDLFEQAYSKEPDGPPNLVAASLLADASRAVELAEALTRDGVANGLAAAGSLQTHLHYAGHYKDAAEVGELVFAAGPASPAQIAFEVACSWSRAGEAEEGLRWVEAAVDAGFKAPGVLDGEPDLLEVRNLPGWTAVRAKLD